MDLTGSTGQYHHEDGQTKQRMGHETDALHLVIAKIRLLVVVSNAKVDRKGK